mgnify:CR=1 FL=1
MKNILFIINPIAGPKIKKLNEELIHKCFSDESEYSYRVLFTDFAGHAKELIEEELTQRPIDILAVAGGDGTINEIAPSLLGKDITLAIIPAGSGNGLAHHLRIPMKFTQALELIKTGTPVPVDLGKIENEQLGTEYFLSNFGAGYDAEVIHEYSKVKQRGFLTYMFFMVKSIFTLRPKQVAIEVDGLKETLKPFVFTVANSSQYGYRIEVVPDASVSDGQLDSLLVRDANFLRVLKFAVYSTLKIKDQVKDVAEFYDGNQIDMHFTEKTKVQIDGEPFFAEGDTSVRLLKHALKIIAPS